MYIYLNFYVIKVIELHNQIKLTRNFFICKPAMTSFNLRISVICVFGVYVIIVYSVCMWSLCIQYVCGHCVFNVYVIIVYQYVAMWSLCIFSVYVVIVYSVCMWSLCIQCVCDHSWIPRILLGLYLHIPYRILCNCPTLRWSCENWGEGWQVAMAMQAPVQDLYSNFLWLFIPSSMYEALMSASWA